MKKQIKIGLALVFGLYFGWLGLEGWKTGQACSFVHPFLNTSDEAGCVERHVRTFMYWKRVLFYLGVCGVSLWFCLRNMEPPTRQEAED